jgi:RES domain-containing protein
MIVYRCSSKKWIKDLSGRGAYLHGGRWNSQGHAMIYTAENNVLAALEVAIRIPLEFISSDYLMIALEVPDDADVYKPTLATNWKLALQVTQKIGDDFLNKGKHLLMKVPSALVSDSYNFLINPDHTDSKKIKLLEPRTILFDKRLMEMIRTR